MPQGIFDFQKEGKKAFVGVPWLSFMTEAKTKRLFFSFFFFPKLTSVHNKNVI